MTETVYTAAVLAERYRPVWQAIHDGCLAHGVEHRDLFGTKNIWCRDYMSLQVGNHFVEFDYRKDFKKYPQLAVPGMSPFCRMPINRSTIVLDGGNIQRCKDRAICTDIIFEQNIGVNRQTLIRRIEELLEAELIIIPHEPGDTLGHADGMVHWINEQICFVCNFHDDALYWSIADILGDRGIKAIAFPLLDDNDLGYTEEEFRLAYPKADEFNPGWGYYINYLELDTVVFAPVFNVAEDEVALNLIKKYRNKPVLPVDCSELSMEGGLVNCVTWDIRSDDA